MFMSDINVCLFVASVQVMSILCRLSLSFNIFNNCNSSYSYFPSGKDPAFGKAEALLGEMCTPPDSEEGDRIKHQQLRELAKLNGTYKDNAGPMQAQLN
jgi:hypothetical protein